MISDIAYYRTADPQVIAACRRNDMTWNDFMNHGRRVQEQYGVILLHTRNPFTGGLDCAGVSGDTGTLPGRWTKPDRHGRRRPYRNNLIGRRILDSSHWEPTGIPGMPSMVEIPYGNGCRILPVAAFAVYDAAYARVPDGDPTRYGGPIRMDVWEACERAAFDAAKAEYDRQPTRIW